MKLFILKTAGLNPDYYIAAHTNVEALATLFMDCEMSFDDLDYEDKIIEVPESEWKNIDITYDHKKVNMIDVMKDRKYAEVIGSDASFFIVLESYRNVISIMEEYNDTTISQTKFQGLKAAVFDGEGKTKVNMIDVMKDRKYAEVIGYEQEEE